MSRYEPRLFFRGGRCQDCRGRCGTTVCQNDLLIKEASLPTITEILQVDGLFTFAAELGMQSSIRRLTTTGFFRDVL